VRVILDQKILLKKNGGISDRENDG